MDEYEATFEITSRTDARAVERLLERLYDSLREESRTIRTGTSDSTAMLETFETLRDIARRERPGTLTVVFTQRDEGFDERA